MRICIKERKIFGTNRINSLCKIDDLLIKENLFKPNEARVDLFFRGRNSSGILTLGIKEAESLLNSLKTLKILPKKIEIFDEKKKS
jgi:hypothetical protein